MKKLIILALALMLFAGILLAQKADMKGKDMPPQPMMRGQYMPEHAMEMDPMMSCMDELKLTDAQMKKFEELRMGFTKTKNTAEAEIENLQLDMHAAMKAENFSQAKALNKQIFAKKNALADARIDFMAARVKELSTEQKEIMKKYMMNFQGGRHQMRGNGQGMMMHKQGMMMNRKGMQGDCNDCGTCPEGPGKGMGHQNMMKMK
jgi:hypothetical protein